LRETRAREPALFISKDVTVVRASSQFFNQLLMSSMRLNAYLTFKWLQIGT